MGSLVSKREKLPPTIEQIAEELERYEDELRRAPGDEVLRRLVEHRQSDRGRYHHRGVGGSVRLLVDVAQWRLLRSGAAIPVAAGGGGFELVDRERYEQILDRETKLGKVARFAKQNRSAHSIWIMAQEEREDRFGETYRHSIAVSEFGPETGPLRELAIVWWASHRARPEVEFKLEVGSERESNA